MTESEILAAVKKRTGRSDLTSVSDELYAILVDMTARHAFLKSSEAQSWTDGTPSYAFPTNANKILHITEKLTSSSADDTEPLTEIPFSMYLHKNQGANDEGEPEYYAIYNKSIYPYLIPNTTYTATVYFSYIHPSDLSTISLDDRFKECVINGVCFIVMGGELGVPDENSIFAELYENQMSMLASDVMDAQSEVVSGYY